MATTKAFELSQQAVGIVVDNAGEITNINIDTDAVPQGTTNLYFTQQQQEELNADATALAIALG